MNKLRLLRRIGRYILLRLLFNALGRLGGGNWRLGRYRRLRLRHGRLLLGYRYKSLLLRHGSMRLLPRLLLRLLLRRRLSILLLLLWSRLSLLLSLRRRLRHR